MEELKSDFTKPSAGQSALYYGLLFGVAMILMHLILFLTDMQQSTFGIVVSVIVMLAGIVLAQLDYRNKKWNGYIAYGKAFKIGFLTMLFAAIIVTIYTYIYHVYINPSDLIAVKNERIQEIYNGGYTPEQEAQAIKYIERFVTPVISTVSAFASYLVLGAVISLITSIFIKKEEQTSLN